MFHTFSPRLNKGFTLIELLVVVAIIALLAAILFPVFGRARENARRSSCQSNLKQIGLGITQYSQDYDEKMVPLRWYYNNTLNPTKHSVMPWPSMVQPYVKSAQVFQCPSNSVASAFRMSGTNRSLLGSTAGIETPNGIPGSYVGNGGTYTGTSNSGPGDFTGSRPLQSLATQDDATPINPVSLSSLVNPSKTITVAEYASTTIAPIDLDRSGTVCDAAGNNCLFGHLGMTNMLFADGHVKAMKPTATSSASDGCLWTVNTAVYSNDTAPRACQASWVTGLGLAEQQLAN